MIMQTLFGAPLFGASRFALRFSALGRCAPFAFRRSGLHPSLFGGMRDGSTPPEKRAERAPKSGVAAPKSPRSGRRKATREARSAAALLLLASLPGCFSLGRDSPALEQYVIGGAGLTATMAPIAGLEHVAVGVRRIDLAPYIASPAIVVRRGTHEVVTSDFHRWGENPADGISRAVARHMGDAASFLAVDVAPWPVRSRYDYVVQLRITRFEGVMPTEPSATEGTVHVRATWEIIRQRDETVLARGLTEHWGNGWRVGDYAGLVALLNQGLAVLAWDVATAMGSLAAAGSGPG
jgi:uncharacterized protein